MNKVILVIIFAIIVTVGIMATTFFTLENNLANKNKEEKIQARVHAFADNGTKYVKINDLAPNSEVQFVYPYTGNATFDLEADNRWELVRLPKDLVDKDDISSFRAYNMYDIHIGCLVVYRPEIKKLVEPCHDDTFEPLNGIAVAGLAKDYNFKNNALPNLDLGVDDEGYIYAKTPTFEVDKNGVIGLGRNPDANESLPVDFRAVYSFGVGGKNLFDTRRNLYLADMVCDPPKEITIRLSQKDLQKIWQSVYENNFFELENFTRMCKPTETCMVVTPAAITTITVTANGKTHFVMYNSTNGFSQDSNLSRFENVSKTISDILSHYEEISNLPKPRCGYQ